MKGEPIWPYVNRISFLRAMANPMRNPIVNKCIRKKSIRESWDEMAEYLSSLEEVTYMHPKTNEMVSSSLSWSDHPIDGTRLHKKWSNLKWYRKNMNRLKASHICESFAEIYASDNSGNFNYTMDIYSHAVQELDDEALIHAADNNELAAAYALYTTTRNTSNVCSNVNQNGKHKSSNSDELPNGKNEEIIPAKRQSTSETCPTKRHFSSKLEKRHVSSISKNLRLRAKKDKKLTEGNDSDCETTTQLRLELEIEELKLKQAMLKSQHEKDSKMGTVKNELINILRESLDIITKPL